MWNNFFWEKDRVDKYDEKNYLVEEKNMKLKILYVEMIGCWIGTWLKKIKKVRWKRGNSRLKVERKEISNHQMD